MSKVSKLGLKLNLAKSQYHQKELVYLGHVISGARLQMLEDRVEALLYAESPRDVTSLRSFLGKVGFYEKFLERRAEVCTPLYALLKKDAVWRCKVLYKKVKSRRKTDRRRGPRGGINLNFRLS